MYVVLILFVFFIC